VWGNRHSNAFARAELLADWITRNCKEQYEQCRP
jgi:hypothetical protein